MWKDPWLSTVKPTTPVGPAREEDRDLMVLDLICRGSMEWNMTRINQVLPHLSNEIRKIKPSLLQIEDSYAWLAAKNGNYTAKSGYYVALSIDQANTDISSSAKETAKAVWNSNVSPKIQLFLWKIINGALPLGENLATRRLLNNSLCGLCGEF